MVLSGIVVGAAYPALIQRFQDEPTAQQLEKEFIQRNIDATLFAYGLDEENLEVTRYEAKTDAEEGALRTDAETAASIRLLDPPLLARRSASCSKISSTTTSPTRFQLTATPSETKNGTPSSRCGNWT